jgi:hypothetical protein
MIEVITGAYHAAHCEQPEACPANCPGRMDTKSAVAVYQAVIGRIDEALETVLATDLTRQVNLP